MIDLSLLKKEIRVLVFEKDHAQSRLDYWFDKDRKIADEWRAIRDTYDLVINRLLRLEHEFKKQQGDK